MKKRILSFLLCLTLLMSYLPVAAQAEPSLNRVADPSTMDSWKQFFTPEPLNTQNAGGVWTDKSVFTDAAAFTGIAQREQNSFLEHCLPWLPT